MERREMNAELNDLPSISTRVKFKETKEGTLESTCIVRARAENISFECKDRKKAKGRELSHSAVLAGLDTQEKTKLEKRRLQD